MTLKLNSYELYDYLTINQVGYTGEQHMSSIAIARQPGTKGSARRQAERKIATYTRLDPLPTIATTDPTHSDFLKIKKDFFEWEKETYVS